MKIRLIRAELFHVVRRTGGRTDMTKLIAAFLSFANAPKKEFSYPVLPDLWNKIAVGSFEGFEILPNEV